VEPFPPAAYDPDPIRKRSASRTCAIAATIPRAAEGVGPARYHDLRLDQSARSHLLVRRARAPNCYKHGSGRPYPAYTCLRQRESSTVIGSLNPQSARRRLISVDGTVEFTTTSATTPWTARLGAIAPNPAWRAAECHREAPLLGIKQATSAT